MTTTNTRIPRMKVPGQAREIYEAIVTGGAAISESVAPARPFRVLSARLHMSAAPTTSEDFTITLNDSNGAAYDTVLYKRDLSVGSVTDLTLSARDLSIEDTVFKAADTIDVAYTNTDTGTYSLVVEYELL